MDLSDKALLRQLLGPRNPLRLYQGSLSSLFGAAEAGCAATGRLYAARELVRRALAEELNRQPVLSSPVAVKDFLRLTLGSKDHEVFLVLFLDAQLSLIAVEEMFRGTLSQTSVYPREIVKAALRRNAASLILAHNHPSGVAEPSRADEHLTQTLKSALALVDVRVLDHFVVTGQTVVGLAELGLI